MTATAGRHVMSAFPKTTSLVVVIRIDIGWRIVPATINRRTGHNRVMSPVPIWMMYIIASPSGVVSERKVKSGLIIPVIPRIIYSVITVIITRDVAIMMNNNSIVILIIVFIIITIVVSDFFLYKIAVMMY
jgi:hypothetical protein